MYTTKDIEFKSIFVINCIEGRSLRMSNGVLMLEDSVKGVALTKLPFQKILALFVIGPVTITTPLIEKCTQYGVPLVVMKSSLRPIFFFSITAEANYLLRRKQTEHDENQLIIPKNLVFNKITNQLRLLEKTKLKNSEITDSINSCKTGLERVHQLNDLDSIMGIEGRVSKSFFLEYYKKLDWHGRYPRTKSDPLNTTLDIGYTILFNYIEANTRLFGFDPYIGVYHRLWFRRKSLICDLMEPFRCIIDQSIRKSFNNKQFKYEDFKKSDKQFFLKPEKNGEYVKIFYDGLIAEKSEIFKYIRDYYRSFMKSYGAVGFPQYIIK